MVPLGRSEAVRGGYDAGRDAAAPPAGAAPTVACASARVTVAVSIIAKPVCAPAHLQRVHTRGDASMTLVIASPDACSQTRARLEVANCLSAPVELDHGMFVSSTGSGRGATEYRWAAALVEPGHVWREEVSLSFGERVPVDVDVLLWLRGASTPLRSRVRVPAEVVFPPQ